VTLSQRVAATAVIASQGVVVVLIFVSRDDPEDALTNRSTGRCEWVGPRVGDEVRQGLCLAEFLIELIEGDQSAIGG